MDLIAKTQELIEKYDLRPNSYLAENPYKRKKAAGDWLGENDPYFQASNAAIKKFITPERLERVAEKWYGYDLYGVPPVWLSALDEFFELLKVDSPDFRVLQWKKKLGGYRGYTDNISEDAQKAISMLERVMYDEKLIY